MEQETRQAKYAKIWLWICEKDRRSHVIDMLLRMLPDEQLDGLLAEIGLDKILNKIEAADGFAEESAMNLHQKHRLFARMERTQDRYAIVLEQALNILTDEQADELIEVVEAHNEKRRQYKKEYPWWTNPSEDVT